MSERATTLHGSPWRGVFYITGGGSLLASELLTTAGASKTLLELAVPYATAALHELLGGRVDQACSDATARALAMRAWQRAAHLSAPDPDAQSDSLIGYGCTASLATDRVKRGECRAHLALQSAAQTVSCKVDLEGDRAQQEAQLLEAQWAFLQRALVLPVANDHALFASYDQVEGTPEWRDLLLGATGAVAANEHTPAEPKLLLPGSFNPLHDGHREIMRVAELHLGLEPGEGAFELSIANVDKPPLDYLSLVQRLRHFDQTPMWLTTLPRFDDKAQRFPGTVFAVGADTIVRIAAPRYYADTRERNAILRRFAELDVRFLVFGRVVGNDFKTLSDLRLPKLLRERCIEVSEDAFRNDISSSQIRASRRTNTNPARPTA